MYNTYLNAKWNVFYNLYPINELCVLTVCLETHGGCRAAAVFALA